MAKKEKIDYAPLLPSQPPEELWEYEPMKKALDVHALIFKSAWIFEPLEDRNVQMAEVHCTCCGEVFYSTFIKQDCCSMGAAYGFIHPETNEAIKSGDAVLCPYCGTGAKAIHTTAFDGSKYLTLARSWPMTFHKIGDHFGILTWFVKRYVDKNGACRKTVFPYEAYVSEGKSVIKLAGYRKNYYSVQQLGHWEQRARCDDTYRATGKEPVFLPSLDALGGTEMENSKLEMLLKKCADTYPISYMQVYLKHNNIENLLMQGLAPMVDEMLGRFTVRQSYSGGYGIQKDLHGIDWKKMRPCEMLRMNKQEFEFFKANCPEVDALMKWELMLGKKAMLRIEDLPRIKRYALNAIETLLEIDPDMMRAVRYLERQERKYPKDHVTYTELRDYRAMLRALGEEGELYPQRLKTAHDQVTAAYNRNRNAIRAKGVRARYKELSRFCFEYEGLMIRPAKNEREFAIEGKMLHHCVRSYYGRHAEGSTAIFFIRKTDAPEEPFFTLEYSEKTGKVIQNRGKCNCARTPEVEAFEAAWLEWIKNGMKQEKEKKGHGKSKQCGAGSAAA